MWMLFLAGLGWKVQMIAGCEDEDVSDRWDHALIMKHRWAAIGWGDRWHHFWSVRRQFIILISEPDLLCHMWTALVMPYAIASTSFLSVLSSPTRSLNVLDRAELSWALQGSIHAAEGQEKGSWLCSRCGGVEMFQVAADGLWRAVIIISDGSLTPPSVTRMSLWTQRWNETRMKRLKLFSPRTRTPPLCILIY